MKIPKNFSSDMKHFSSMSDGISLLNSDNSLTNLPMFFSIMSAQKCQEPWSTIDPQSLWFKSEFESQFSGSTPQFLIYDDYRFASQSEHGGTKYL